MEKCMKIAPISVSYSDNCPKKIIRHNNKIQKFSVTSNSIDSVYPKNYYLSFKAEPKSPEIQELETFVEDFYEQHKGKLPKSENEINVWDIPQECRISRFVTDTFVNNFNSIYKSSAKAFVGEEKLIAVLDKTINDSRQRMSTVTRADVHLENFNVKAENIIQELKDKNKIPQVIYADARSSELRKINNEIFRYILKIDIGNERTKEFFSNYFVNKYYENMKKYNDPVVDTEFVSQMKELLAQEPFKTFNKKSFKIKAQDAINNSPTLDETVDEIYKDMIKKHITPFDNPKMYNYVIQHDEKLDYLLEQIYGYGKDKYDEIFEQSKIDKKHKVLLIDPGVASRFEELAEFVNNKKIDTSKIEPFELRQKFSDYLGTETVYRGMYFYNPEEGIEQLKQQGARASSFKKEGNIQAAIEYFLAPSSYFNTTIKSILSHKISSPQSGNPFLSVTSIYDIAAAVPKKYDDPECPVVVIKTELPKLSMIKQKGRFANIQHGPARVLCIDGKRYPYETQQDKIEAFVPFFMPTDNAQYTVDTSTGCFSWL